jgi:O-antigen/teichoic acid export membrane protein
MQQPPIDHEKLKQWIAEAQERNRIAIWRGISRLCVPLVGILLGFSYGPAVKDGVWYAWIGLVVGTLVGVGAIQFLWKHGVRE